MFNLQGKLKILALCICALSCSALGAQKVWKACVAIETLPGHLKEYKDLVGITITDALSKSDICTVIDYKYCADIIGAYKKGQEMIDNGLMAETERNALGSLLGNNLIIIAEITDNFGFLINCKVINMDWELTTRLIKQLRNEPPPQIYINEINKEELTIKRNIKRDIEQVIMDDDGVPEWNRIKAKEKLDVVVVVGTDDLNMKGTSYGGVWQISGRIRIELQKGKDGKDGKAVTYYQLDRIIANKDDIRRIIEGRIQLKSNTIVRELLSRLKR